MMDGAFRDRRSAGRVLTAILQRYVRRDDVAVVARARGGVPIAYEVARALHASLDVLPEEGLVFPAVAGRTVILVDDGMASAAPMGAAVAAVREHDAEQIVVAVPVAAAEASAALRLLADHVVCALTPTPFGAVGAWYEHYAPVGEDEIRRLLGRAVPAARDLATA